MVREPIHPGEFLADELKEIEMTATELSRQIDVPPNRISQIVRCKRDITADTALRLGQFLGLGRNSGSTFNRPMNWIRPKPYWG